jgi:predicted Zn-dependent protease with MMP-like domain
MKRMSLRRFGRIVARVLETLPPVFEKYLDNVVVDVEDEPGRQALLDAGFSAAEIDAGASAYGLFAPLRLPSAWGGDVVDTRDLPHRLIIYKRPLEDDFPERAQLLDEIRKTVIHELAHHFGYTDRDLERWTSVY